MRAVAYSTVNLVSLGNWPNLRTLLAFTVVVAILVPLICAAVYLLWVRPHKWRGQMLCRACGYRWRTRLAAPASQCGKCWHENVVPVSEAEPNGISKGGKATTRVATQPG